MYFLSREFLPEVDGVRFRSGDTDKLRRGSLDLILKLQLPPRRASSILASENHL